MLKGAARGHEPDAREPEERLGHDRKRRVRLDVDEEGRVPRRTEAHLWRNGGVEDLDDLFRRQLVRGRGEGGRGQDEGRRGGRKDETLHRILPAR